MTKRRMPVHLWMLLGFWAVAGSACISDRPENSVSWTTQGYLGFDVGIDHSVPQTAILSTRLGQVRPNQIYLRIPYSADTDGNAIAYEYLNADVVENVPILRDRTTPAWSSISTFTLGDLKRDMEAHGTITAAAEYLGNENTMTVTSVDKIIFCKDTSCAHQPNDEMRDGRILGALLGAVMSSGHSDRTGSSFGALTGAAVDYPHEGFLFTLTPPAMYNTEIKSKPEKAEIWLPPGPLSASTNTTLLFSQEGIKRLWLQKVGYSDCRPPQLKVVWLAAPLNRYEISCDFVRLTDLPVSGSRK